ncbi:Uncharacterised protein [Segatella copri]|nr:Uncharacterised protein [Segatella copri]
MNIFRITNLIIQPFFFITANQSSCQNKFKAILFSSFDYTWNIFVLGT